MSKTNHDDGFGLFMLLLLAANVIPTVIIYNVLWVTGAAWRDMAAHCNDRGEVVAHALLLTWGVWAVIGLAAFTWKAQTPSLFVARCVFFLLISAWVFRGFF